MFDPDAALGFLSEVTDAAPTTGWPSGAPIQDFVRSAAAARVGHLAAPEGMFCFQFEHRFALDTPDGWVEPGREGDAAPPSWSEGRLPEPKYQSFRHDLMVASFHPGHRGKWTTHELCHALVGYAWKPGASAFFHATAGRLAELLPVVLYYFVDEVRLTRCPLHQGGGALYREFCQRCEDLAALRPPDATDRQQLVDAARFLDAELAAVARSRRLGLPVAHRHGSLDLCSDGVAYARAHQRRLGSEAMFRMQPFLEMAGGCWADLDALEARVEAVARSLVLGEELDRFGGGAEIWAAQDLAFRMLTIWEETDGEAAEAIVGLLDRLAAGEDLRGDWDALASEYVLPGAETVFCVGYGGASSVPQVRAGLESVTPLTLELASDAGVDLLPPFVAADPSVRRSLGDRFTSWLSSDHPDLAELAAFETAIRQVTADPLVALGPGEGAVLCDGSRVLFGSVDLSALSAGVDSGEVEGRVVGGRVTHSMEGQPTAFVVGRALSGDLILVELDPDDARAVVEGRADMGISTQLCQVGVMRPLCW